MIGPAYRDKRDKMDVYLSGGQQVRLRPGDLLGQGGEGVVYASGSQAYKIYHDPSRSMQAGKIQELAKIRDPRVVAPADLLFDAKHALVGYRMALAAGRSVCEVMTRAYRTRRGLGQNAYHRVVDELRDAVVSVHRAGVVLVDLNDLNVLVENQTVRIIDLDSAQTPGFPATALQVLVRDPLAKGPRFDEGSDWYAFAILAFELFCGAHPFRGTHPGASTIGDRMRLGLSALHPQARLPPAAYPVAGIPPSYRNWIEAILSNHHRQPPTGAAHVPVFAVVVPQAAAPSTCAAGRLTTEVLLHLPGKVLRVWCVGTRIISLLEDGSVYLDADPTLFKLPPGTKMVAGGARRDPGRIFSGYINGAGHLQVFDLVKGHLVPCTLAADDVATTGNVIVYRQLDAIYELSFVLSPNGSAVGARRIGNCMPRTTRLGDGAALQVQLQTLSLSMLSEAGTNQEIPLPELQGYKPLDVWASGQVAAIRAAKGNRVDRIVVRVLADGSHTTRIEQDCPDDIDMAGGPGGIIADRVGDQIRLWRETDAGIQSTLLDLPPGDVGPLSSGPQMTIIAPLGNSVVRLKSHA